MWTKFAKSFKLAASLAALLLPLPFANACGIYYVGEEYRVALLNPYVVGDEWAAFYYSAKYLDDKQPEKHGKDRQRNCAEWAAYIGNGITAYDVRPVVYGASYDELLNAVADGENPTSTSSQQLQSNPFFTILMKKEKKAVLDYLMLAKEYEHFSALASSNPWANSWETSDNTSTIADKGKQAVQEKMAKKFKSEKDEFLRRRYAYQLLVLSRYAGDLEQFEQLYAVHFRDNRSDALSDWATFHRASMVPDTIEGNYLLALSFQRCPEKRFYCFQHFKNSLLEPTLAFCKNNQEKALVYGLAAIKNPGRALDLIKKINALDPSCPLLPLLVVRETSKLEDWLLTDELTGMGVAMYPNDESEEKWEWDSQQWVEYRAANKKKDQAYLADVQRFVSDLTNKKGGALGADLANLLAGHLFLMDKQATAAEKYLTAISPKTANRIAEQQLTEQILVLVNRSNIADAGVKDQLAKLLLKLKTAQAPYSNGKRDFAMMNLLLSQAYFKQGDLLTAYFFNNHSLALPTDQRYDYGTAYYELIRFLDWRATEKDIDNLLALMVKKDKTAFERYLNTAPLPSRNALLDLRGTISFRKNELTEAVAAFEKVDKDFWQTKYMFNYFLVSDPFTMAKDSLTRGEFPDTKTAFAKRLLELENEAKSNPNLAAKDYLLLGTAWLNCTYHGKSWMMFSYGNSVSEWQGEWGFYSYRPRSAEMMAIYYQSSRALAYLQKAKAASKDKEVHAQVDFLVARHHAWNDELTPEEQANLESLEWDQQGKFYLDKEMSYFKDWVKSYKSTGYYDEATSMCPILLTYFGN